MKQTFLWRFSVTTSAEAEEAVTELLGQIFAQPVSSFADAEKKILMVSVYCPQKPSNLTVVLKRLMAGLANIRHCGLNPAPGKISCNRIRRESWAHSWKRHFKPLEIGSALLIKPSWSRRKQRKGQGMVVLDPGLSFGTGQHATTGFCLRELVRFRKDSEREPSRAAALRNGTDRGKFRQSSALSPAATGDRSRSFLDMGTGSGILAIAAAKLGYSPIHAFDFDPESVRVARANARKNDVLRKIQIAQQDLTRLPRKSTKKFDLVCANLISNLLIAERERIISRLKPAGKLVLAGILKTEFGLVQNAYKQRGLKLVASRSEKEWRSGAFTFG